MASRRAFPSPAAAFRPRFLEEQQEAASEPAEGQRPAQLGYPPVAPTVPSAAPGVAAGATGAVGAAAGAKALPFVLAITGIMFVIVVLGVITLVVRYLPARYFQRAAASNAARISPGGNGGEQRPGGLDAARIAAFPVCTFCLFPAANEDEEEAANSGEGEVLVKAASVEKEGGSDEEQRGHAGTEREINSAPDSAHPQGRGEKEGLELMKEGSLSESLSQSVSECTVCLGEFSEGELLRCLLPCRHRFHVACIDPWLAARTTCPVCRTDLQSAVADVTVEEVTVKVEG